MSNLTTYKIEGEHYSQRNNELVWPSKSAYPNAQYRTDWRNMCNVTAYVEALALNGWKFPAGKYEQPEDNLAEFILNNKEIREAYHKELPALYDSFERCLEGKCTESELKEVYFPNEIHKYLAKGANLWLKSSSACTFMGESLDSENFDSRNFESAIKTFIEPYSSPLVVSTDFGGFGHIVTVTGATINEKTRDIVNVIISDPWGKLDLKTNKYPSGGGGSGKDVVIPWDFVLKHFKPYNNPHKIYHYFKKGIETV